MQQARHSKTVCYIKLKNPNSHIEYHKTNMQITAVYSFSSALKTCNHEHFPLTLSAYQLRIVAKATLSSHTHSA
jgi:hypothetical protein